MKLLSKPHVLLRADAGPTTGYGHFIRTSALAAYLAGDFECEVLSFDTGRDSLAATNAAFLERVGKEEVVVLDNYSSGHFSENRFCARKSYANIPR